MIVKDVKIKKSNPRTRRKRCKVCGRLITKLNFSRHKCLPDDKHEREKYNKRYNIKQCDKCEESYGVVYFPNHKCKEDKI